MLSQIASNEATINNNSERKIAQFFLEPVFNNGGQIEDDKLDDKHTYVNVEDVSIEERKTKLKTSVPEAV